ncbi:Bardet-Biedl syndrome 10 protein-like isoform X1 [Centruroides sculpturatus]|uniref:Bardet-Biedl syndrome 10 protein-like isoform X1 n=1 Tax=Centruroides sculpturatus TaxID=218467 RepID=UPI000C6D6AD2|nr:Bardet-Biedl syndrome 10 protein-like isoform X1 [Centruroides sculpturatus]
MQKMIQQQRNEAEMEKTITLQDYIQICSQLSKNIKRSFGPRGQIVFILTCTGQVEFTTNGLKIINSLHIYGPIAQIIQRSLEKYHNITGDGSKIFLLLLNEMFVNILEMKESFGDSYRMKLINGFNSLLHIILPKCFQLLKFKFYPFVPKDIYKVCFYLLKTFFNGKFGTIVSDYLADLTYKFIIKYCKNLNCLSVKYLIDHFDTVCTTAVSLSVNDSQVKPGIVLSQGFLVDCEYETTDDFLLKFIVYINDSNNSLKESSLFISKKQTVNNLFQATYNNDLAIMEMLSQHNISVIICAGVFPDLLKEKCKQYKIYVIAMVPLEEINYLLTLSQIEPVHNISNPINERNCSNLSFVKSIQVGNKNCAYLGLQCNQSIVEPYHLLLCGPTESICKQYSKECLNCLKLIYCWRSNSDKKENCNIYDNSRQNKLEKIFAEDIKRITHKLRIDGCEKLSEENSENILATIVPGGGCWEMYFHYILENLNLYMYPLEVSTVCKILSKSLLVVPQILYENNQTKKIHFIKVITSIIEQLNLNNVCYFNKWGEIQCIKEATIFELIVGKELLIFSVIELIIQLLRVDCVANI